VVNSCLVSLDVLPVRLLQRELSALC
jgi:hypothetical protein